MDNRKAAIQQNNGKSVIVSNRSCYRTRETQNKEQQEIRIGIESRRSECPCQLCASGPWGGSSCPCSTLAHALGNDCLTMNPS